MKYLLLITALIVSIAFANDTYESTGAEVSDDINIVEEPGPIWDGPLAEIFNNGPWFNSAGTGFGGADESILESWCDLYGSGCQLEHDNLVADDFEVPTGETWEITSITVGGYQSFTPTTPTINGFYFAGYDDNPNFGTVIYGDIYTNVFTSAVWSGVYRVTESGSGTNTDRAIHAITAELSTPWIVTEGTYWVGWQLDGTASSGPWAPFVVIMGTQVTGNSYQSTDGGIVWDPILNGGYMQGILMIFEGEVVVSLDQTTWGSIKSIF
ncbi:MAG: hypothetical protein K8S24_01380 [Candidatus Aegiribacteria sp.]|nr:hypothetical protein [Candidatus Aegiribacteria sp.]